MYVAVLNTQKGVLQEDAERLREEMRNGKMFCPLPSTTLWKVPQPACGIRFHISKFSARREGSPSVGLDCICPMLYLFA